MSQENVDIVLRAFAALNTGGAEEVREFLAPDVVFVEPPEQPGATTYTGRDEAVRGFGRWAATWESQVAELERIVDAGDCVVVLSRQLLTGRDGIQVTQRNGTVLRLRDGLLIHVESYWDQAKALAAAGLEE
jgi:ketosteroid isomerase-like protein